MLLGQRTGATITDLRKVNAMYNCNGAGAKPNINTVGEYQSQGNAYNAYHIF